MHATEQIRKYNLICPPYLPSRESLALMKFKLPASRRKINHSYHFGEDTAQAPDVHGTGVLFGTKKDLGCPVPERDHLVGVWSHRNAEGPGQSKVGQLDAAL